MNRWLLVLVAWLVSIAAAASTTAPVMALVSAGLFLALLRIPAQLLLKWLADRGERGNPDDVPD